MGKTPVNLARIKHRDILAQIRECSKISLGHWEPWADFELAADINAITKYCTLDQFIVGRASALACVGENWKKIYLFGKFGGAPSFGELYSLTDKLPVKDDLSIAAGIWLVDILNVQPSAILDFYHEHSAAIRGAEAERLAIKVAALTTPQVMGAPSVNAIADSERVNLIDLLWCDRSGLTGPLRFSSYYPQPQKQR